MSMSTTAAATVPETLPPVAQRADAAYLDFVEGFRAFLLGPGADFENRLNTAAAAEAKRRGRPLNSIEEVRSFFDSLPLTSLRDRLVRTQQEMKWHKIGQTYEAQRDELLAELAAYDARGPGKLELDPNFEQAPYANVHFHLQPGGYHKDDLGGFHYHYGTKVFFRGENDRDGVQSKLVAHSPLPADGKVERILDLACSVGQSTTAWKVRCPDAEVTGIDHSETMLRVAHRRAVMHGVDVTFAQRLAEDTRYPDAHFDIVFAFILFHELPVRVIGEVVREAARVLRPGGVFTIYDFAGSSSMNPYQIYHRYFDARHNNEPYSQDFCDYDLSGALRESGFDLRSTPPGGGSGGAGTTQAWFATRR
jgi:ubiquinone/menaquinone biosynthesis C-methylase UbiE